MSRKYKFHNPLGLYFITITVKGWVEIFILNEYKEILIKSIVYCQKHKGLKIFAWCIMPNHIHMIAKAEGKYTFSEILRDFKKYTSKAIFKALTEDFIKSQQEFPLKYFVVSEGFRFWQAENHPIELWSNKVIAQKLNYIHQNPVEMGLVNRAENYVYSSAIDYAGEKGLMDITLID